MPSHLKELVHARMSKTGESYEQALRHVRAQDARPKTPSAASNIPWYASRERASNVADTAFSIAAIRAAESRLPEGSRLFEDPHAGAFADEGAHVAESTRRYLDLPFFSEGIRLRTRFIDDVVRDRVCGGAEQLVLLGAGFDVRGTRLPEVGARDVAVFEIDTAAQLKRKRRVLTGAGVKLPSRVHYVPFEFVDGDLETKLPGLLVERGFRMGAPTVFVWEGVIGYIDAASIDASLRFMATTCGDGGSVIFTHGHEAFDPETAASVALRAGFGAASEVAGDELWRRYLAGEPHPAAFVMRVTTVTP